MHHQRKQAQVTHISHLSHKQLSCYTGEPTTRELFPNSIRTQHISAIHQPALSNQKISPVNPQSNPVSYIVKHTNSQIVLYRIVLYLLSCVKKDSRSDHITSHDIRCVGVYSLKCPHSLHVCMTKFQLVIHLVISFVIYLMNKMRDVGCGM